MIDTRVRGNPDDIRSAGNYLSEVLSGGISDLADSVAGQRVSLQRGWVGEGGSAFTDLRRFYEQASTAGQAVIQTIC